MPRPSGACAMPRGTSWWALKPVVFSPENEMRPPTGLSIPLTARSVLVLPAPLAPMSATTSPRPTFSVTPRSAWMAP